MSDIPEHFDELSLYDNVIPSRPDDHQILNLADIDATNRFSILLSSLDTFPGNPDQTDIHRLLTTAARISFTDRSVEKEYQEQLITKLSVFVPKTDLRALLDRFIGNRIKAPTDNIIQSPKDPRSNAILYLNEKFVLDDVSTVVFHINNFYCWRGNGFVPFDQLHLNKDIATWLDKKVYLAKTPNSDKLKPTMVGTNTSTIRDIFNRFKELVVYPENTPIPSWRGAGGGKAPANEYLSCSNAIIHVPTGVTYPQTPQFFNTTASAVRWDPKATCPRWHAFLDTIFAHDPAAKTTLQQYMGLLMTGITSYHKMLWIVGPTRSGKSTITRIINKLFESGTISTNLEHMAGSHGLQPFLGKSIALLPDVKFGKHSKDALSLLLGITGEDSQSVNIKFGDHITTTIRTRFVAASNDLPKFDDNSLAIVGRVLILRLRESFLGREDITLFDHLLPDLPGILCWAVEGFRKLLADGKFTVSSLSKEASDIFATTASPMKEFADDCCVFGEWEAGRGHLPSRGPQMERDHLWEAWRTWCVSSGYTNIGVKTWFVRDFLMTFPDCKVSDSKIAGRGKVVFMRGVELNGRVNVVGQGYNPGFGGRNP